MSDAGSTSYPLPDVPALAEVARALRDGGHWAQVCDASWNLVYVTDELRRTFGGGELARFAVGSHFFGPASVRASRAFRFGSNTQELLRTLFGAVGGLVAADTGRADALRTLVDPMFADLVDTTRPADAGAMFLDIKGAGLLGDRGISGIAMRIREASGALAGTALIYKPALDMATIAAMTAEADAGHLQRVQAVARASRRPAAILFADLEGSSPLARRLSTASYFALSRRLVQAADRCVVEAGGLVGRHVGDGVVAFFLSQDAGSESSAARACIEAARALKTAVSALAARSDLSPDEVVMRFGLHWGATLYVGNITTQGRAEVTALGEEVNEAARIEACATGGRTLASKDLVERLDADDAQALGIGPKGLTYRALADLDSATDKARRDAPAIPVCEL